MNVTTSSSRRLYTKSIEIAAPVERVFNHLKDPTRSWTTMGTQVHDVKPTPEGLGTTFEWEDRMFGFRVTGTNEFTEFVPNQRLAVTASKGFIFGFDLEAVGDNTRLTLGVDDVPSNRLAGAFDAVATKLTEHDMDDWLADTKAELETGVARHRQVDRHLALSLSVTIKTPVAKVYPFLTDPQVLLGSAPGTKVTEVELRPDATGTTLRWHSRIVGFPASVAMEYTAAVPMEGVTITSSSGFVQNWKLQPVEEGTRLTLSLENELSGPIGGVLRATMLRLGDRYWDEWLDALAAAVEERAAS